MATVAKRKIGEKPEAKILDDGTLMLFGVIGDAWDGLTSAEVIAEVRGLGTIDELPVLINSRGGLVDEGLAIYHELATHPAKVTVDITGVAASMASVIAMAGDTIRIAKNAHLMIHDPWNVAVGNAEEMRRAADLLDQFGTSLVSIYAERTGMSEDDIRDMMGRDNGDGTWMTADEALEMGFVDEIIGASEAEAFADLDISELASVPAALTRQIREGRRAVAEARKAAEPVEKEEDDVVEPPPSDGEEGGSDDKTTSEGRPKVAAIKENKPAENPAEDNGAAVAEARDAATKAERERGAAIRKLADQHNLGAEWAEARVTAGDSIHQANAAALDALVNRQKDEGGPSPIQGGVGVDRDDADKWLEGATNWLLLRSGNARLIEKHTGARPDPGEFRGMTLFEIARDSLDRAGISSRGKSRMDVAGLALGVHRPRGALPQQTTSDFPILLENVLHKLLRAAYEIQPDTWRRFCAQGSVVDFRPHPRIRMGTLGSLDNLLESGEFEAKNIPDGEKESIQAGTKGNLVGLDRQSIVNDDLDAFTRIITMLGRASSLSIEVAVYNVLATNGGLGPNLSDGNPLFFDRGDGANNIVTPAGPPSVAAFDAARVAMASMKDPSGNEILDIRPYAWVGPIGLGGEARVVNDAEFDVDQIDVLATNRFMVPNKVRGLVAETVDTARLGGPRWYMFANPAVVPVIEVVFLEGEEMPVIDVEEGFEYDGVRWRVRLDFGVAPTEFRGAVTNAGA